MEPLDDRGDERPGQVVVDYLVIRSQVGVHLLFPEHAVSDIHIGRCDTGEDSFLDLRAGIVELEFEASSLYFFLSLFLRTFAKQIGSLWKNYIPLPGKCDYHE